MEASQSSSNWFAKNKNEETCSDNMGDERLHRLPTNQDWSALKSQTVPVGHYKIRMNAANRGVSLGERIWPLAKVLSSYLYVRSDVMRGVSSLLELGAGPGLVGITASRMYDVPGNVVLTDHDPAVKRLLSMNIEENFPNSADRPRCAHLKWGEGLDQFKAMYGTFDLILGSDLLYTRCSCRPLFQTVAKLLGRKPSSLFLLAYKERRTKLKTCISQDSKDCGLVCREIPLDDIPECLGLTRNMDEVWFETNGATLAETSCIFEFRWKSKDRNGNNFEPFIHL